MKRDTSNKRANFGGGGARSLPFVTPIVRPSVHTHKKKKKEELLNCFWSNQIFRSLKFVDWFNFLLNLDRNTGYFTLHCIAHGPDSSVGIATELQAGTSGIESRWGRNFPHLSRPALRPTRTGSFQGVEAAGAWGWPPNPYLECRGPRKEYSYTSTHPKGLRGL